MKKIIFALALLALVGCQENVEDLEKQVNASMAESYKIYTGAESHLVYERDNIYTGYVDTKLGRLNITVTCDGERFVWKVHE